MDPEINFMSLIEPLTCLLAISYCSWSLWWRPVYPTRRQGWHWRSIALCMLWSGSLLRLVARLSMIYTQGVMIMDKPLGYQIVALGMGAVLMELGGISLCYSLRERSDGGDSVIA